MNFFNRFRSRIRRSRPLLLEFQKLEDRNLLAGDVTVFIDSSSLFVTGDAQANQIQIVGTLNGSARVIGLDGTTINGGTAAFEGNFPGLRSATVNLGGGDDTVSAEGVRFNRGLVINAGAGNDNLLVRHSSVGQMILRGEAGDDTLTIDNVFTIGSAEINLGNGTNMLAVLAQAAGEDIRVQGGTGDDTFVVAEMGMFGAMQVDLAGGNDRMLLAGETWVGRNSSISLGGGDDFFAVLPEQLGAKSQMQKFVMIDGGGGADNFSFGSQVTTKPGTFVNGSNGTDGIQYGNADFSNAQVLSFENDSFDQTALLDALYESVEAQGLDSEIFGGDIIPDLTANLADVFLTLPENSAPVNIDGNLTLTGPQDSVVTGAVVTLEGFQAGQDSLNFTDTADITGSFNATTGVLTLTGNSSLTDYQTALRSVTISNDSEDPATDARTLRLEITDSEGQTASDSRAVNVISVTDPPVITVADGPIEFDLDDANLTRPVIIDAQLIVSDVDTQQFTSAAVTIIGFQTGDVLSFTAADGITGEFDSVNGILNLSGEATVEQYQNALRTVAVDSTADAVRVGTRTIRFSVTDGANGTTDEIDVNVISGQLTVRIGNGTGNFVEKSEPVAIASDLTLGADAGVDAMVNGATVRVTAGYVSGEDLISFVPIDGISGSLDEAAGILTLTGDATVGDYAKVLQTVTYGNSDVENEITAGIRTFEFAVRRDGVEVAASKSIDVRRLTDEEKIQSFLTANSLTSEVTDTGLHFIVNQEGNGTFPQPGGTVLVNYTGRLLDGTQFDASPQGQPFEATLTTTRLIAGWVEGIPKFSEGGSGKLLIPAVLAYGTRGQGTIPPNAVLEFDIEVVTVLS